MGSWMLVAVVVTSLLAGRVGMVEAQGLQYAYYETLGCRGVEDRVRTLVRRSFLTDATASAALLRLAFHDCQVGPVSRADPSMHGRTAGNG